MFQRIRDNVADFGDAFAEGTAAKIERAERRLNSAMDALTRKFERSSPFLAMKRHLLAAELAAGGFGDLAAAGLDLAPLLSDFDAPQT